MTWDKIDEMVMNQGWSLSNYFDKVILTHPEHGIKIMSLNLKNVISMSACEMSVCFKMVNKEWRDIQAKKYGYYGKSVLTVSDLLQEMMDLKKCVNKDYRVN